MEEKKKSKGLVVALVLFILVSIGLGGYIGYEKLIVKDTTNTKSASKESKTKVKEKELDINSRLVQELYNRVSWIEDNGTCRYGVYSTEDFVVENGDESIKMMIVGRQLSSEGRISIDGSQVEKEIKDPFKASDGSEVYMYYHLSDKNYSYSKDYIEKIYKRIFGKDAKLDTSIKIRMDHYNAESYIYNAKLDKYVLYNGEGGGTCGPTRYEVNITKAVINNDTLKIYENEKTYATEDFNNLKKGDLEQENNYIYTFKLEDDNMYSFVSRVKENK